MQTINNHITAFIIITTAIVFLLAILIVTLLYLYQKRQIAFDKNLNTLCWEDSFKMRHSVDASIELIGSAISDLSDLSKSMNPEVIGNMGLTKSLQIEVDKLVHMAHLEVEYHVKGEPIFMSSEKELIVFRIVQESFNNIVKHSKATHVLLQLNYCNHVLDILIKDNGIG